MSTKPDVSEEYRVTWRIGGESPWKVCQRSGKGRCGLMSDDGEWVVEPKFKFGDYDGTHPLRASSGEGYGFYDVEAGEWVVEPSTYDHADEYSENRVWVQNDYEWPEKAHHPWYGYVLLDEKGDVIEEFGKTLKTAQAFHDSRARAWHTETDLFGYIAPHGSWAIEPAYDRASDFEDGRAEVTTADGEKLTIDTDGKPMDGS